MKESYKNVDEAFGELKTQKPGLSDSEAANRIKEYGFNELVEKQAVTPFRILLSQFKGNFLLYVLIVAALVSYFAHELINFYVISFIVFFIIILGFFQEYKAENAVKLLKSLAVTECIVLRNGAMKKISSKEIVPGDILVLGTGDRVPADSLVVECTGLRIDESALTGESVPVDKHKNDIVYSGTFVVNGKCTAVATATGMRTKIGEIAKMIQASPGKTLLQIETERLAKMLTIIVFAIAISIFAWGVYAGVPLLTISIIAIAVAVAGVPEGLPLTLTSSMVLGMQKMAKANAIVRKVLAVETIGSVTVICVDKTGTLTKNEMTAENVYVNSETFDITGSGYAPKGSFLCNGKVVEPADSTFSRLLAAAALCNNAELHEKKGQYSIVGDPTEGALLVLAAKAGLTKAVLEQLHPRDEEIIFTAERKMMSTVHISEKEKILYAKGAPEFMLSKCSYIESSGLVKRLTKEDEEKVLAVNKSFASRALRVLALAYKKGATEKDLVFLGLVAMRDPPREEVAGAIEKARKAGIKVVMITGDNEHTAKAMARDINLAGHGDEVITGKHLDSLGEEELLEHVEKIVIYARTFPEHKMRIVNAFRKKGYRVAMSGDGINDAPAIKKADVGIAMGIRGTDVTKEAADIVLTDDNFATIVTAVENGRAIHENIQKITYYLVSTTLAETFIVFFGIIMFGFNALPLLALQVLLVNMVTEEMPAIALGIDPPRKDIMESKKDAEKFLTGSRLLFMVGLAIIMTALTLFAFSLYLPDMVKGRTMAFVTIVSIVAFNAFSFKSMKRSLFTKDITNNKWLLMALAGTAVVTVSVVYVPFLQGIFSTVQLEAADWLLVIALSMLVLLFMELKKLVAKIRFNENQEHIQAGKK